MKNNFKDLEPEIKLPDNIKREMLSNLETTKTIFRIIDLFLVKAGQTFSSSLSPSTESISELLEGELFDVDAEELDQ